MSRIGCSSNVLVGVIGLVLGNAAAAPAASSQANSAKDLTLDVGDQRDITLNEELKNVTVRDPAIVDVRSLGNNLLVFGTAAGRTTVTATTQTEILRYDIVVLAPRPVLGVPSKPSHWVRVSPGSQKEVTVSTPVTRLAVGDTSVADARILAPNTVAVLGVTQGQTMLIVWGAGGKRESYLVTVTREDPAAVLEALKKALAGLDGLEYRIVGNSIYIDGCAGPEGDDRVREAEGTFPNVHWMSLCDYVRRPVARDAGP